MKGRSETRTNTFNLRPFRLYFVALWPPMHGHVILASQPNNSQFESPIQRGNIFCSSETMIQLFFTRNLWKVRSGYQYFAFDHFVIQSRSLMYFWWNHALNTDDLSVATNVVVLVWQVQSSDYLSVYGNVSAETSLDLCVFGINQNPLNWPYRIFLRTIKAINSALQASTPLFLVIMGVWYR